jgi:hypothetical protein
MSTNISTEIININLDYIIHLDHDCEEDCPCGNDNAVECEEEDCENCRRGKFCDCEDKGCPQCNKDEKDLDEEEEEWCEEHEQIMWKDGGKCGGCLDEEEMMAKRNEFINTMNNGTEEEIVALVKKLSAADGLSDDALAEKIAFTLEAAKKQKEFAAKISAFEAEINKK